MKSNQPEVFETTLQETNLGGDSSAIFCTGTMIKRLTTVCAPLVCVARPIARARGGAFRRAASDARVQILF
jgi:hypothetical protein